LNWQSFNNCHVGIGKVNQHCNSATAAKHTLRYAEPITANKEEINGGISKEVNGLKKESIGDTETGLDDNSEKQDAFLTLAENIKTFIIKSDLKRKDGGDGGGSSGWTSWADVSSSMELQKCVDMVTLSKPVSYCLCVSSENFVLSYLPYLPFRSTPKIQTN